MSAAAERRLLQAGLLLACLVPLLAGAAGIVLGTDFLYRGALPGRDLDSHFRYLSGLLFGIGLAFLACVPRIEKAAQVVRTLAFLVFVGGIARLTGLLEHGAPGFGHMFGLMMELVVTPLIALWQARVARRFA